MKLFKTEVVTLSETEMRVMAHNCKVAWGDRLLSLDPEFMAELYLTTGTLQPTKSPVTRRGREEIAAYFREDFMPVEPVCVEYKDEELKFYSDTLFSYNALYNFEIDGPDEKRIVVECREVKIWMKDENGKWGIDTHNSAVLPPAH